MKWGVRKEYKPKGRKAKDLLSFQNDKAKIKKDMQFQTKYGKASVDYYDYADFRNDASVIKEIADGKIFAGRYAKTEYAQKVLDSLPKQTKYKSEAGEILANNHNGIGENRLINCFECSMAWEMRMRGYDVQAKQMAGGLGEEAQHAFAIKDAFKVNYPYTPPEKVGYDVNALEKRHDQIQSERATLARQCYKEIEQQCLEYGEGARGCIAFQYWENFGGGHSMQWEVKDGKLRIIDSQQYGRDGYEIFSHVDTTKDVLVQRLDNADILPGVIDFVEAYEMTEEEKALEKKKVEMKKIENQRKAEKLKVKADEKTRQRDAELAELRSQKLKAAKRSTSAKKAKKLLSEEW